MLCMYFIMRCKQSHTTKNDQPDVVLDKLPVPVYEDIDTHALPQSPKNKKTIELKENVAYGPI